MNTVATVSSIIMLATLASAMPQHYTHQINLLSGDPSLGQYPGVAVPGVVHDPIAPNPRDLAHKAVVENAAAEEQLPADLLNPFYKNPQIVAALAKDSWFGDKEFPVFNRQADKISREEIAKIVHRIQRQRR